MTDVVCSNTVAVADLGRDQHVVAPRSQCPGEPRLALTLGIDVGRVEQVDAGVECDADDAVDRDLVEPADDAVQGMVCTAERARAERDPRDKEADTAELLILHASTPAGIRPRPVMIPASTPAEGRAGAQACD